MPADRAPAGGSFDMMSQRRVGVAAPRDRKGFVQLCGGRSGIAPGGRRGAGAQIRRDGGDQSP